MCRESFPVIHLKRHINYVQGFVQDSADFLNFGSLHDHPRIGFASGGPIIGKLFKVAHFLLIKGIPSTFTRQKTIPKGSVLPLCNHT